MWLCIRGNRAQDADSATIPRKGLAPGICGKARSQGPHAMMSSGPVLPENCGGSIQSTRNVSVEPPSCHRMRHGSPSEEQHTS